MFLLSLWSRVRGNAVVPVALWSQREQNLFIFTANHHLSLILLSFFVLFWFQEKEATLHLSFPGCIFTQDGGALQISLPMFCSWPLLPELNANYWKYWIIHNQQLTEIESPPAFHFLVASRVCKCSSSIAWYVCLSPSFSKGFDSMDLSNVPLCTYKVFIYSALLQVQWAAQKLPNGNILAQVWLFLWCPVSQYCKAKG